MNAAFAVGWSLSQQVEDTMPSHVKLDMMLKMMELVLAMIPLGGVSTSDVNRFKSMLWQFACHAAK